MNQLDKTKFIANNYQLILNVWEKQKSKIDNDIQNNKYSKGKLYFICGAMGSGKSTFIKHYKNKNSNDNDNDNDLTEKFKKCFYSNIDVFVTQFSDKFNNYQKYLLCREVGIMETDYLLENNISMVIEGTGINDDTIEYFERIKKANYTLITYFLKTNLEVCRQRIKNRNKIQSHKVNDEDIIKYYNILWTLNDGKYKNIQAISDQYYILPNFSLN